MTDPAAPPRPRSNRLLVVLLVGTIITVSAMLAWLSQTAADAPREVQLAEVATREVPLPAFATAREAEYSGATAIGSTLLFLPQYPQRVDGGALVAIERDDVAAWLRGDASTVGARTIAFDDEAVRARVPGFEGYEALVPFGDDLWFAIEARRGVRTMEAWLVRGSWDRDAARITLDADTLVPLRTQTRIGNKAYEALTVCGDRIIALYELASPTFVPEGAVALAFDPATQTIEEWPVPALAFRITDATLPRDDGTFRVMNYAWPGDRAVAHDHDPLGLAWGAGATHARSRAVERIVTWRCGEGRIEAVDEAPLLLTLAADDARNWESLVDVGDGFVAATDYFPRTHVVWVGDLQPPARVLPRPEP